MAGSTGERVASASALSVGGSEGAKRQHGPRTACQYHCVACGGHFTSLSAFDAHRRTVEGESYSARSRYCDTDAETAQGKALLVVKTEDGSCSLAVPPSDGGCTVWATPGWWKAAQAFAGSEAA